mmetsp:Transcript_14284/g.29243  ORF Transcript_14284/g.29243 Transcript_14284/m.29243 type:complete len:144 (+) Transcript_14284:2021-2452(+)
MVEDGRNPQHESQKKLALRGILGVEYIVWMDEHNCKTRTRKLSAILQPKDLNPDRGAEDVSKALHYLCGGRYEKMMNFGFIEDHGQGLKNRNMLSQCRCEMEDAPNVHVVLKEGNLCQSENCTGRLAKKVVSRAVNLKIFAKP